MASRPIRTHRDPAGAGEGGFAIVEILVGMGVFAVLAAGFAATMATSLQAQVTSRMRATATQLATAQVEKARALSYDEVGTVNGNPTGILVDNDPIPVGTTTYQVQTTVDLVNDPVPGAYPTYADYKRLVVTVTNPNTGATLARLRTLVAPPTQPSLTKAVVRAQVTQLDGTALPGITLQLAKGPSGTRTGISDVYGFYNFAALAPTTTAFPAYEVTAINLTGGWKIAAEDLLPANNLKPALATQAVTIRLRAYKDVPLAISLKDQGGAAFTTAATVTVSSDRGTTTYPVTGGSLTVQLPSGVTSTVGVSAPAASGNPFFAPAATFLPTSTQVMLTTSPVLTTAAVQAVTVQLRMPGGGAAPSKVVHVRGGTRDVLVAGTTDASGNVVLNLPSGTSTPYSVNVDLATGFSTSGASFSLPASGPATTTVNLIATP